MKANKLIQLLEVKRRKTFEIIDYSKGEEDGEYYISGYVEVPDEPIKIQDHGIHAREIAFMSSYNHLVKLLGQPHEKSFVYARGEQYQWHLILSVEKVSNIVIYNSMEKSKYKIDDFNKEIKFVCEFGPDEEYKIIQQFIYEYILGKKSGKAILPKTVKPKVEID